MRNVFALLVNISFHRNVFTFLAGLRFSTLWFVVCMVFFESEILWFVTYGGILGEMTYG